MARKKTALAIQSPLSSIYLFYGEQTYLIRYLHEEVVKKALNEEDRDFNLSIFDMEEDYIEAAVEDALTLPFMGEKKVVSIWNPSFLTQQKKNQKIEHNTDRLLEYIESPSPDTIMLICAPYAKLDKRKKIVKKLLNTADAHEVNQLNENELFDLLQKEAKGADVTLTKDGYETLLRHVGLSIQNLVNEVRKMALYCGENGEINGSLADEMTSKSLESNVFELVNHVMNHKGKEAFALADELLKQKEEPIKLLALITRQVRIVLQVKLYQKQGYSQQQMAGRMRLHPFAVKIASGQAKQFDEQQLYVALNKLSEADYSIKRGKRDKVLALQMLIDELIHL